MLLVLVLLVFVAVVPLDEEDCVDSGRSVVAAVRLVTADRARAWPACRGADADVCRGLLLAVVVGDDGPPPPPLPDGFLDRADDGAAEVASDAAAAEALVFLCCCCCCCVVVVVVVVLNGGSFRVEGALPRGFVAAAVVVAVVCLPLLFSPVVVGIARRPVAVLPENTPESGLLLPVPVVVLDARARPAAADEEEEDVVVAERVSGFTGSRLGDVFRSSLRAAAAAAAAAEFAFAPPFGPPGSLPLFAGCRSDRVRLSPLDVDVDMVGFGR